MEGGTGSTLGPGTKILHATRLGLNNFLLFFFFKERVMESKISINEPIYKTDADSEA